MVKSVGTTIERVLVDWVLTKSVRVLVEEASTMLRLTSFCQMVCWVLRRSSCVITLTTSL